MISYYTSKNPGLSVYIALIAISAAYFLLAPLEGWSLGILCMGWGVYTFMRALSLLEVTTHNAPLLTANLPSRTDIALPSSLPVDLIKRINGKENLSQAQHAFLALAPRSLIWLALAALYALGDLYFSLHSNTFELAAYIRNLSILFILGAAFWSGQTYATHITLGYVMFSVFVSTLMIVVFNGAFDGVTIEKFANLMPLVDQKTLIAAPLFLYCAALLLPSLLKDKEHSVNALAGIFLLGFIGFVALALPTLNVKYALLVCGWGLFSMFWIRAASTLKKTYRLIA